MSTPYFVPHWPKSGEVKKNFLLPSLAVHSHNLYPHFQNRGAAPDGKGYITQMLTADILFISENRQSLRLMHLPHRIHLRITTFVLNNKEELKIF